MAGIKNFNLSGVGGDLQLGKRGGRVIFDEGIFKFTDASGVDFAGISIDDLVVNGNLTVLGDTTTIQVETVTVEDNIIELNAGETGAGVTKGTSGIEINRGTESNAQLVWDEASDSFRFQLADGTPVSVIGDFEVDAPSSLYRDDGKVVIDTSLATSADAEYVQLTTTPGQVVLGAKNEAGTGDVDLVLKGQGNGTVIFTGDSASSDGNLSAQQGTNLLLSGGDEDGEGEVGDVILRGGDGSVSSGGDVVLGGGANGGTVRIDTLTTTVNDTSSDDTVATVGYVKSKSSDLNDAIITINGRLDTNEGAIGTLQSEMSTVQGEVGTITTELGELTTTVTTNDGRLDTLEANAVTTFAGLTDTPADFVDGAGKFVVVNATNDGLEFVELPEISSNLIDLTDTPDAFGTAGQVLVVNETLDGMVFADQVDTFAALTDTPELGTAGQVLAVSGDGLSLEFVTVEPPVSSVLELSDTPEAYGTPGQVLGVNGTGDGIEYIDVKSLSAIELADMNSSVSTMPANANDYMVIAQPMAFTDADGTTESITVTRITVKVSSGVVAGEGIRIRVKNDGTDTESSVIATQDMTDIEEGVYVIDGIFSTVTMSPLHVVEAALVDQAGTVVSSETGSFTFLVEYKTNIS